MAVAEAFEKRFNVPIFEGYGQTEAAPVVTLNTPGNRKAGTIGRALPEVEVAIWDDENRVLPPGEVGEIMVRGRNVMKGYHHLPEETAKTITNGWLHTGDLGYLSNGELFVCGRAKDIIIINGRKYHPQDLELGIGDLAGIRPGRVAAFGSVAQGRADRAVIVVEPSGSVPAGPLADSIRRRIVDLCGLLVDDVVLAPRGSVERTTSGKVRRSATKLRYEQGDLAAAGGDQTGLHV